MNINNNLHFKEKLEESYNLFIRRSISLNHDLFNRLNSRLMIMLYFYVYYYESGGFPININNFKDTVSNKEGTPTKEIVFKTINAILKKNNIMPKNNDEEDAFPKKYFDADIKYLLSSPFFNTNFDLYLTFEGINFFENEIGKINNAFTQIEKINKFSESHDPKDLFKYNEDNIFKPNRDILR